MADGFLGRWSRRKLDIKEGKPVEADPPAPAPVAAPIATPVPVAASAASGLTAPASAPAPAEPAPPLPTLDDVAALTAESDFSRFAATDVSPEVRNAAMKKLFSDPHYNVMDGLDIYIGDYNTPDPMPESMLRSLVSSQTLGLFSEPPADDKAAAGVNPTPAEPARQSTSSVPAPAPADVSSPAHELPPTDADPDLRLQQDDAPGPQGSGDGAR